MTNKFIIDLRSNKRRAGGGLDSLEKHGVYLQKLSGLTGGKDRSHIEHCVSFADNVTEHFGEQHFTAIEGDNGHFHLDALDLCQTAFSAIQHVLFITLGVDLQKYIVVLFYVLIEDGVQFPDRYQFFGDVFRFRGIVEVAGQHIRDRAAKAFVGGDIYLDLAVHIAHSCLYHAPIKVMRFNGYGCQYTNNPAIYAVGGIFLFSISNVAVNQLLNTNHLIPFH